MGKGPKLGISWRGVDNYRVAWFPKERCPLPCPTLSDRLWPAVSLEEEQPAHSALAQHDENQHRGRDF